jgi:hypothetical protein
LLGAVTARRALASRRAVPAPAADFVAAYPAALPELRLIHRTVAPPARLPAVAACPPPGYPSGGLLVLGDQGLMPDLKLAVGLRPTPAPAYLVVAQRPPQLAYVRRPLGGRHLGERLRRFLDRRRSASAHRVPSFGRRPSAPAAAFPCLSAALLSPRSRARGPNGDRRRPSLHCHAHTHRHTARRSSSGGGYGDASAGSPRCRRGGVARQIVPASFRSRSLSAPRASARSMRSLNRFPGLAIAGLATQVTGATSAARAVIAGPPC